MKETLVVNHSSRNSLCHSPNGRGMCSTVRRPALRAFLPAIGFGRERWRGENQGALEPWGDRATITREAQPGRGTPVKQPVQLTASCFAYVLFRAARPSGQHTRRRLDLRCKRGAARSLPLRPPEPSQDRVVVDHAATRGGAWPRAARPWPHSSAAQSTPPPWPKTSSSSSSSG